MEHEELRDKELSELEAALGGLLPRPSRVDRDRLLFLAGQASASSPASAEQRERPNRRNWLWPAVSAVSTAAAVVLAVLLAMRPGPQVVREIVYVERQTGAELEVTSPEPQPPSPESIHVAERIRVQDSSTRPLVAPPESGGRRFDEGVAGLNYLALRERVLASGIGSLPEPPRGAGPVAAEPATRREMLHEFLGRREADPSHSLFRWAFFTGETL